MQRSSVGLCFLLAIAIAISDLLTRNLNVSILYLLPLLLATKLKSRRVFWAFTLCLIGLTFSGYFLASRRMNSADLLGYRLANRMLTALAIIATAARASALIRPFSRTFDSFADGEACEGMAVYDVLLTAGLLLLTFIADLLSPAQYNLPILYAVPLTVVAILDRPRLLVILLVCSIIATVVGFFYPESTVRNSLQYTLLQNRFIACITQFGIVILCQNHFFCKHVWTVAAGDDCSIPGDQRRWICSFCGQCITLAKNDLPIRPEV